MKINGACLCGEVAYEAEVDPAAVFACHCNDCQTQSGTAFRTVVRATPGSFRTTRGELRSYLKTAESGNKRSLAFCPNCGTSVYGGPAPGEEGYLSLRVGAFEQRDALTPRAHVWTRSAQPWVFEAGEVPRFETQPQARPREEAK